ncbi:MAG: hypothetical protein OXL34_15855 [Gemmatimonadota bacterium]|nr:hypothetical protein [Gemmatimonadota bacterium]
MKTGTSLWTRLAARAPRRLQCSRGLPGLLLPAFAWGMAIPGAGSAQLVGDHVRVMLSEWVWAEGVVVRITPDELELSLPWGHSRRLASTEVQRIEQGVLQRQWKRGFLVGTAVGGALGLLAPVGFTGDVKYGEIIQAKLILMPMFAAFYGMVGAAVGGLFKREVWTPVQGWPRSAGTPRLLMGPHNMPNGNASFVLGAKLRF